MVEGGGRKKSAKKLYSRKSNDLGVVCPCRKGGAKSSNGSCQFWQKIVKESCPRDGENDRGLDSLGVWKRHMKKNGIQKLCKGKKVPTLGTQADPPRTLEGKFRPAVEETDCISPWGIEK